MLVPGAVIQRIAVLHCLAIIHSTEKGSKGHEKPIWKVRAEMHQFRREMQLLRHEAETMIKVTPRPGMGTELPCLGHGPLRGLSATSREHDRVTLQ